VLSEAWTHGMVSAEQALSIGQAVERVSPAVDPKRTAAATRDLVRWAKELPVQDLRRVANRMVEVVDPDGVDAAFGASLEAQEREAMRQAVFRGRKGFDGIARFSGRMPNLQFDMLTAALDALTAPRRTSATPSSDAESDLIATDLREGNPQALTQPHPQRRGQSFCELIEHRPTDELPRHGVGSAQVVVTIDHDALRTGLGAAALDSGDEISAGEARRLACNAGIIPAVLDGPSRVLDLGTSRRLFDRHQRLALALRDGGCVFPGCDRPPSWTEAHHRVPWSRGGPTDLANGCLLCGFHHRLIHQGEWVLVMARDGVVEAIPPAALDPLESPRRNARFVPRRM